MGPPGPGAGIPVAAACIAATIWANRAALAGGGPGGPGGPAGPTGPAGPGTGGGGGVLLHLLLYLLLLWVVGWVRPSQKPNVTID